MELRYISKKTTEVGREMIMISYRGKKNRETGKKPEYVRIYSRAKDMA